MWLSLLPRHFAGLNSTFVLLEFHKCSCMCIFPWIWKAPGTRNKVSRCCIRTRIWLRGWMPWQLLLVCGSTSSRNYDLVQFIFLLHGKKLQNLSPFAAENKSKRRFHRQWLSRFSAPPRQILLLVEYFYSWTVNKILFASYNCINTINLIIIWFSTGIPSHLYASLGI